MRTKSRPCRFSASVLLLIAVLSIGTLGCRTGTDAQAEVKPPPPPPIVSIRVGDFRCDNEVIGLAVRNVFIEILSSRADVKVVRDGDADVVIEGTVTLANGDSSSVGVSGAFAKGQRAAGSYVSGVTSLATKGGAVLTSASWGQSFGKGENILPPETVANRAADRMLGQFYREGLKRRSR